jgi:hypothetical protein
MGEDTLRISGGVNDAIAVYFADAALANVFLARWYTGQKAASADGLFRCGRAGRRSECRIWTILSEFSQ